MTIALAPPADLADVAVGDRVPADVEVEFGTRPPACRARRISGRPWCRARCRGRRGRAGGCTRPRGSRRHTACRGCWRTGTARPCTAPAGRASPPALRSGRRRRDEQKQRDETCRITADARRGEQPVSSRIASASAALSADRLTRCRPVASKFSGASQRSKARLHGRPLAVESWRTRRCRGCGP